MYSKCGLQPLRQYWQEINRHNRHLDAQKRAQHKICDKKRPKCRCDAYKFPHRPGGGLCRHPDPPDARWQDKEAAEIASRVEDFKKHWLGEPTAEQLADLAAMTRKPTRKYRNRYLGIVRQICRKNGLHPIRDRALIAKAMANVKYYAQQIHRQNHKVKYRNIEITELTDTHIGLSGHYQTAGPMM